MKKQLEWEFLSGDGSFHYDKGSDTYSVKYGAYGEDSDIREFSSKEDAESFYNSIQPESLRYGKALWQYLRGCFPELICHHEAREVS